MSSRAETLTFRSSRRNRLLLVLVLGLLAIGSAGYALASGASILTWLLAAMLLVALIAAAASLRFARASVATLVLDDQGIHDRRLGLSVIPWPEVADARVSRTLFGQDFVYVHLRDPRRFAEQLPVKEKEALDDLQKLGVGGVWISTWDLEATPGKIAEAISQRCAPAG